MTKIVVADPMEKEVIESLRSIGEVVAFPEDLSSAVSDAEVLVVRSRTKVTQELLSGAKQLKIVARAGVGLDNIDLNKCKELGIKVINTPEAPSNAVAELAIASILVLSRNLHKSNVEMRKGVWNKKKLLGCEIEGKTLGIIGYGRIGALLGKKAAALGMKVITFTYDPHPNGIAEFLDNIDELYKKSDYISLHVPVTDETRGMINKETIAKMKDGVYIINTARGEVINEDALYEAVKSGKVAGAALDVYPKEPYTGKLLELENISFTPHLGSSTKESQVRIGKLLIEKLKKELG